MMGRVARLWRGGWADRAPSGAVPAAGAAPESPSSGAAGLDGSRALPEPRPVAPGPEQPVMLSASGTRTPVHVGEILPAARRRWPLPALRLPTIPKRTVLAVGVCAGLAAPQLARHLATRLILGPGAAPAPVGNVLEVTRIVYSGPLTNDVAATIGKALTAGRR